jgi:putative hydrolase of the HAD superfamily
MTACMGKEATELKAVLLDGMGTLLWLKPPAPRLAEALGVEPATAERAFRAEVAYYLEHQLEAFDTPGLAALRRRCAEIIAAETGSEPERALEALMSALVFEPFEDAAPVLRELGARGLRLVVVSNWDCGLPEVLETIGLLDLVDAVITSAAVGASKPDPRIFKAALAAAGCGAAEALHIGDSVEADFEGARAAGIRALHLDRRSSSLRALLSSHRCP